MTTINQIPASIEWKVYKGDTAKLSVFIKDEQGVSIDLDNYTFTGQVRQTPSSEPYQVLNLTSTADVLGIEIEDTASLDRTSYFDIQSINDDNGTIQTILRGTIIAEQDVTR